MFCRFVLAHVFQLVLAFDALVAKNTIQVLALLIFNTLFVIYAAVQVRFLPLILSSSNLTARNG